MENSNPITEKPLPVRIVLVVLIVASATLIVNSIFEFLPFSEEALKHWTPLGYLGLFKSNCCLLWIMWEARTKKVDRLA